MSNNQENQNQNQPNIPYYPPPNTSGDGVESYTLAFRRPPGSGNSPINAWEINPADCYWVKDEQRSARETARAQMLRNNQGGAAVQPQGPVQEIPKR